MTNSIRRHTQNMRLLPVLAALLILLTPAAYGQHVMGGGSGSAVQMQPSPSDDQVLPVSPEQLMLRFSTYVHLVKLTVKAQGDKVVDIGFRYSSEASRVFFWDLPVLPEADYYTIEWAAIDPEKLVARGSFNFAFGSDALPPSQVMPKEEEIRHIMAPDFRLLDFNL